MADRKKKKDHDFNVTAFDIVQQSTGEIEEEPQEEKPSSSEGKNPHINTTSLNIMV